MPRIWAYLAASAIIAIVMVCSSAIAQTFLMRRPAPGLEASFLTEDPEETPPDPIIPDVACAADQAITWNGAAWSCLDMAVPVSGWTRTYATYTVPASGSGTGSVSCASGKKAIGGGCLVAGPYAHLLQRSRVTSGNAGWQCQSLKFVATSSSGQAHAVCVDTQ